MSDAGAGDDEQAFICVVEIPKGSRNKYEYDAELGGIKFDRLLMSAATYPTDYGYMRDTLAEDGDALDVLVCLTEPTFPGCLIAVRALGMFAMSDEHGPDHKIICVPLHDPYWSGYRDLQELPIAPAPGDRAVLLDLQGPRARQGRRGDRLAHRAPLRWKRSPPHSVAFETSPNATAVAHMIPAQMRSSRLRRGRCVPVSRRA